MQNAIERARQDIPMPVFCPAVMFTLHDLVTFNPTGSQLVYSYPSSSPFSSPSILPVPDSVRAWMSKAGVEIRPSPLGGLGVFAVRDIARGTLLWTESPLLVSTAHENRCCA